MPSFETEVNVDVEVEFEVYCNSCGEGLCSESTTTRGRTRGDLQVRVNACPRCMKNKDEEIDELTTKNEELENEKEILENTITELKRELESVSE